MQKVQAQLIDKAKINYYVRGSNKMELMSERIKNEFIFNKAVSVN